MIKLIPIGKRYLIKPYEAANKTDSGFLLDNSNNVSAAPVKGTITEVGDEATKFKVGDTIYFRRYSIDQLKTIAPEGEVEVSLVEEDDVLVKEINL